MTRTTMSVSTMLLSTQSVPTIISETDIRRIRSRVASSSSMSSSMEEKKQTLRRRSQNRQQHWPNTLEALRARKENWKKEKLEREETLRQEIDKQV